MKKPLLKVAFSTLTAALAVGMFFALGSKSKNPNEVKATGADAYWTSVDTSKTGTAMLNQLHEFIDNNTASGESGYSELWTIYKQTDPVPGNNNLIWDMYGGFQFAYGTAQAGNYSKEGDVYNREHSVPKSWWGSTKDVRYCDVIHLVPTDGYVNNQRSNYAFGEVQTAKYTHNLSQRTDAYGNIIQTTGTSKLGSAKSVNGVSFPGSGYVFEPDDQYKGDFARIYYYFATRYGPDNMMATQGDGGTMFSSSASDFYMTNYGKALMNKWHVQDPVSQKELDRNDAVESTRGNRNPFVDHPEWADKIFGSNYEQQHGGSSSTESITISATSTSLAIDETSTLTANLHNVTGTPTWAVTDSSTNVITLSSTSGNSIVVTAVGEGTKTVRASIGDVSGTITITVSSSGGSGGGGGSGSSGQGSITFGNGDDDTNINSTSATGDDSLGNTWTITTTGTTSFTPNSNYAQIGSSSKPASTITFTTTLASSTKITSFVGSFGGFSGTAGTVTLKVGNTTVGSGSLNATNDVTVQASNTTTEGSSLTITIGSISKGVKAYSITYSCEDTSSSTPEEVTLESITIDTTNVQTTFTVGDTFTYSGLVVTAYYSDSSSETLSDGDYTVSSPDMSTASQKTVSVSYTYGDVTETETYNITVSAPAKTLSSISISTAPTKLIYSAGNYFDPTGLVITRNYSDSTSDTYTYANHTGDFTFSPSLDTALTTSHTSVTITHGGESCSQAITVIAANSDALYAKGFGNYTTGSYSAAGTDRSASANVINVSNVTYALQVFNGSTGAVRGDQSTAYNNFSARNTTTRSGYYISKVSLNVNGNYLDGSTSGRSVVYFGTSAYSNPKNTTPSGTSTQSDQKASGKSTLTWTNTDTSKTYFLLYNLKVSGTALSSSAATSLVVTWAQKITITASIKDSKVFHPGDTITTSDISVKDSQNNELSGFTFADNNYQFTYEDATSGGSLTNKTFTNGIDYNGATCSLTVQVQRVAYETAGSVTDTITASDLTATTTSYTDFSNVSKSSSAIYAGYSAKNSGNIQFKSKDSVSGLVSTTSGGTIASVTITFGGSGGSIDVYGKNTAYSSASDLYGSSAGTKVGTISSSGTLTFTTAYTYVGIRSTSGASYVASIAINYGSEDTAVNVSNYIMYTDTNNQCTTKYSVAKGYFQGLSTSERATFMTSNEYVISTARERLEAWARYHGESISLSNGDYVVSKVSVLNPFINSTNNNTLVIIIIVSAISVSIIGAYFFVRRRKEI